ncbi:MAG TPA: zinc ribbon domain-containing protein [bacterium]
MAIYEFRCVQCEHEFEQRMRMGDYARGTRPACPACGRSGAVRSFVGPVGILSGRPDVISTCDVPRERRGCADGSCPCG